MLVIQAAQIQDLGTATLRLVRIPEKGLRHLGVSRGAVLMRGCRVFGSYVVVS